MKQAAIEDGCPVCILAGGRGTRLGSLTNDKPKPLIDVAGRPFIYYPLDQLKKNGFLKVILCVGYLGEMIEDELGDGSKIGLDISYSYDGPTPIGTAAAVRKALPLLGDHFMIMYGDTYLQLDFADMYKSFLHQDRPAMMAVLKNDGKWDTSNVLYSNGVVRLYDKAKPTDEMTWIDYGISVVKGKVINDCPQFNDLSDIYHKLSIGDMLSGYEVNKRFYDIGSPKSLSKATAFFID